MTTPPTKTQKKKVQESPSDYETGEQYVPVYDKNSALDAIFHDADVKDGLNMFASHELNALNLWKRSEKYYLHCLLAEAKSEVEKLIENEK